MKKTVPLCLLSLVLGTALGLSLIHICAFDAVIAANVLHLLSRPEQAVAELWRVVRPLSLIHI